MRSSVRAGHGPADIISTVEFDDTGRYLATGDRGGRVVLFERDDTVRVRDRDRKGQTWRRAPHGRGDLGRWTGAGARALREGPLGRRPPTGGEADWGQGRLGPKPGSAEASLGHGSMFDRTRSLSVALGGLGAESRRAAPTRNLSALAGRGLRTVGWVRERPQKRGCQYKFWTEFQSHEPEFDYLKSLEIEEKVNKIKWCKRQNRAHFLISTNGTVSDPARFTLALIRR